eukprot:3913314-Amphidinium_carterae.1
MQKAHCVPTAKGKPTGGSNSFTDSALYQDTPSAIVHVKGCIDRMERETIPTSLAPIDYVPPIQAGDSKACRLEAARR